MASVSGLLEKCSSPDAGGPENDARIDSGNSELSSSMERSRTAGEDKDSVLYYHKTLEWLEAEVSQHEARLNTIAATGSPSEDSELAADRIFEMEETLTKLSTDQFVLKSMLSSVQLEETLLNILYFNHDDDATASKNHLAVVEQLEQTTTAVSDVLRILQEVKGMQSTMTGLKDECHAVRRENRELMQKMRGIQDAADARSDASREDEEVKSFKLDCDALTAKVEVVQCCLQGVIYASGVNWAKDKQLCDLVLSVGRPIEDLLQGFTTSASKDP